MATESAFTPSSPEALNTLNDECVAVLKKFSTGDSVDEVIGCLMALLPTSPTDEKVCETILGRISLMLWGFNKWYSGQYLSPTISDHISSIEDKDEYVRGCVAIYVGVFNNIPDVFPGKTLSFLTHILAPLIIKPEFFYSLNDVIALIPDSHRGKWLTEEFVPAIIQKIFYPGQYELSGLTGFTGSAYAHQAVEALRCIISWGVELTPEMFHYRGVFSSNNRYRSDSDGWFRHEGFIDYGLGNHPDKNSLYSFYLFGFRPDNKLSSGEMSVELIITKLME